MVKNDWKCQGDRENGSYKYIFGSTLSDCKPVFRIRIHWFRIRHFRLNTDPDLDLIRIQGFDDQNWNKFTAGKNLIFFLSEIPIYLSLGLHKGRSSYRRSLQLTKENIQHFKKYNFLTFSIFVGHFCPPGSDSGSGSTDLWIRIQSRSGAENTDVNKEKLFVSQSACCLK